MHDTHGSNLTHDPAGDIARTPPMRVVLVGETGLDGAARSQGIETVRTRTALEAVGEIAAPPVGERPTLVVVGADAEPNGSLGAFLDAVRSADATVRIARSRSKNAGVGDEAIRDGYDAVIDADASPEVFRRLVARERSGDAPVGARSDSAVAETEIKPIGDSAPARSSTPSTEASKSPPVPNVAAEPKPLASPAEPEREPASEPAIDPVAHTIERAAHDTPRNESAHAAVGDAAMLSALQRSRAGLLDVALPLMARRLGVSSMVFVAHGTPDTDTAPVPSVPVAADGKRFGVIRVGAIDPETADTPQPRIGSRDLVPHAEWLASWLTLHDRHQSLRRAAFTDPLTGAWNRRYFDAFLESALERARDARRTVTVLVFDIDEFKHYNDNYGHPAGDEILVETVRALKSSVRPSDRVCRIGGDEFAVIFDEPEGPRVRGSRPPESVYVLAKRVQRQIGEKKFPKLGDDAPGHLTISGGLAAFPWDGHDAETLLQKADDLACDSKRRGKNAISLGPGAERVCKNAGDEFVD